MAQLSSPGVSIPVVNESFYSSAAPGTTPLVVVASAENKNNASATGTASGTLKANAGEVYLLTSQRDLVDMFGTPVFKTDANNNPVHAGEQNEYGLQAAYSFLGVSNRAYVVRADLDLSQLDATATAPTGYPENGTYWFDTASTKYGVFEWNADTQSFTNKVPTVITDVSYVIDEVDYQPKASFGSIGDYAIVALTTLNKLWFKKPTTRTAGGTWVAVGSTDWVASWPTAKGTISSSSIVLSAENDSITINAASPITGVTNLTDLVAAINAANISGVTAAIINSKIELYSTGTSITISGTTVAKVGLTAKTYYAPALQMSAHTSVPLFKTYDSNPRPTGSVWVKTTNRNLGADWVVKKFNSSTNSWETKTAPLYSSNVAALAGIDSTSGGLSMALGDLYVKYNDDEGSPVEADFKLYARKGVGATVVTSIPIVTTTLTNSTSFSFTISESVAGSDTLTTPVTVSFTSGGNTDNDADIILTALTAALVDSNIVATKIASTNQIVLTHVQGGEIVLQDGTGAPINILFPRSESNNFYADPSGTVGKFVGTLWTSTVSGNAFAAAQPDAPTSIPVDGRLWYNSIVDEVDIMVHNGTTWVGYLNYTQNQVGGDTTDPAGPIVSATAPTLQSDGSPLAQGDLWIDTSDIENYPTIYRFDYTLKKWLTVDTTDQTTENGIVFADARWNTDGGEGDSTIAELLDSNFLDFDAPDPALYPKGMLLWNLRRSGFNVKKFVQDYVDVLERNTRYNDELMTSYYPHRWVSEAGNQVNGVGSFGRKAQRKVVVQALQSLVNSNQQIRDEESRVFNLIACPGYPELISELVSLNYDRGLTSFVIGDSPARLSPDATSVSNWGNNVNGAVEDSDDGLVSFDEYLGVFYPWGYTSDNLGNNIVVPPSHMMLRTIALSDNVSYPWFAPAGTRRGGITNASAVGYVNAEGEFKSVAFNTGQRDTLESIKVCPITYINGTGLVNFGQYTRARNASALDRINVARLVIYIRRRLQQIVKPFIFEPNDKITRDELKGIVDSMFLELVGQRALADFVTVCDESNNTPARIDRNELYLDASIVPVKSAEYIYIPLRIKNTGEI